VVGRLGGGSDVAGVCQWLGGWSSIGGVASRNGGCSATGLGSRLLRCGLRRGGSGALSLYIDVRLHRLCLTKFVGLKARLLLHPIMQFNSMQRLHREKWEQGSS
jgi:hypothetical protein